MNILIVQGPNLNLVGVRSAKSGEQITLDKINRGLRQQANRRPEELTLKILQTHKIEKAMTTDSYCSAKNTSIVGIATVSRQSRNAYS